MKHTCVIIDDVLTETERMSLWKHNFPLPNHNGSMHTWYEPKQFPLMDTLIEIAKPYFDFTDYTGYGMHKHLLPGHMHYDHDQGLQRDTGEFEYPICSIMYYVLAKNLGDGGHYFTDDFSVVPVTNRLNIVGPGIMHQVKDFDTGVRMSVAIQPWPEGMQADRSRESYRAAAQYGTKNEDGSYRWD